MYNKRFMFQFCCRAGTPHPDLRPTIYRYSVFSFLLSRRKILRRGLVHQSSALLPDRPTARPSIYSSGQPSIYSFGRSSICSSGRPFYFIPSANRPFISPVDRFTYFSAQPSIHSSGQSFHLSLRRPFHNVPRLSIKALNQIITTSGPFPTLCFPAGFFLSPGSCFLTLRPRSFSRGLRLLFSHPSFRLSLVFLLLFLAAPFPPSALIPTPRSSFSLFLVPVSHCPSSKRTATTSVVRTARRTVTAVIVPITSVKAATTATMSPPRSKTG